jgi:hypothetical protein
MGIYIFTKKEAALRALFPKNAEFITGAMAKHNPEDTNFSYVDVSGLSAADIKKTIAQIKKCCKYTPWGVVDPKGTVKDPAALFFDGASDYLGPDFFKGSSGSIDTKRLKAASQWRSLPDKISEDKAKAEGSSGILKTGIKIPSGTLFPGWKKMQKGKTVPFYLLYCAVHGKMPLITRLGEKAYGYLQQRLLTFLFNNLREGDGLAWMDSGKDLLFLIPPKIQYAEVVSKACIKMLASAPVIAMDVFGLNIPVYFVFALHYGPIRYSPPGETGTVVSDAVNFIFHLGGKKAEPGRLTLSGEIPDGSVPKALEDCFVSAGEFEGRKVWHSKKFSYSKPW